MHVTMVQTDDNLCKLFKSHDLSKVVSSNELASNDLSHIDQPYACACIETMPK
jgi:hypothetical protein